MNLDFSIIIPVYNRPQEINELLESLTLQSDVKFEVIVIEDGSTLKVDKLCDTFNDKLNLSYYFKENSGAGASRNFGMQKANGNYFIILDSDCVLPQEYLAEVKNALNQSFSDGFGGPDTAHHSFSIIQKAINYAMTSVVTTGGLRGHKNLKKFQPRSFNMGLSKKAFECTDGFSKMKFGEDIDLSFRLWEAGMETQFIEKAYVYHKRRISWSKFFKQTFNFGAARPILNKLYPGTSKITYWFPSVFFLGTCAAFILSFFKIYLGLYLLGIYISIVLIHALVSTKSFAVAINSVFATFTMFFGYGVGFIRTWINLKVLKKSPKKSFPEMFNN